MSDSYTPTASRFTDKVVIVTGAGAGIGWETARRFAAEGGKVAVLSDPAAGKSIADTIASDGGEAISLEVDVTDEESVAAAVAKVVETWGTVDVLVNNAGHGDPIYVSDMKPWEWNHLLSLNLGSIFVVSKAVWPIFAEKKTGAIVNASSITGSMAMFGLAAYGASKAGIATATRVMAMKGGKDGIASTASLRATSSRRASRSTSTSRTTRRPSTTRWHSSRPWVGSARPAMSPRATSTWPPTPPAG